MKESKSLADSRLSASPFARPDFHRQQRKGVPEVILTNSKTPEQSLAMLRGVLANQEGPAKNIVIMNAGVVLYAAGVASTMAAGIDRARAFASLAPVD